MHWVEHRCKFIPLQGLWVQSTSFLQVVLLVAKGWLWEALRRLSPFG